MDKQKKQTNINEKMHTIFSDVRNKLKLISTKKKMNYFCILY